MALTYEVDHLSDEDKGKVTCLDCSEGGNEGDDNKGTGPNSNKDGNNEGSDDESTAPFFPSKDSPGTGIAVKCIKQTSTGSAQRAEFISKAKVILRQLKWQT